MNEARIRQQLQQPVAAKLWLGASPTRRRRSTANMKHCCFPILFLDTVCNHTLHLYKSRCSRQP